MSCVDCVAALSLFAVCCLSGFDVVCCFVLVAVVVWGSFDFVAFVVC